MKSEKEIKNVFFKYMHVYKAMATLQDYLILIEDISILSETFIFEDNIVKFDIMPKYFFQDSISSLYPEAFQENKYLKKGGFFEADLSKTNFR